MNSITFSCHAAGDLQHGRFKDGKLAWATVFAIHNQYIPANPNDEESEPKEIAIPITVKFTARTAPLAAKTIRKGCPFAVIGQLDFYKDPETAKEWYSILAQELFLGSQAAKPEEPSPEENNNPEPETEPKTYQLDKTKKFSPISE